MSRIEVEIVPPVERTVCIKLTESDAGKLMGLLMREISWSGDFNGRTAEEVHSALEAAGIEEL